MGDGQGTLQTYVETYQTLGKNSGDAVTPLTDLGVQVGTVQTTIQDGDGARTVFIQDIQNIGTDSKHTEDQINDYGEALADLIYPIADTDQFDTSMIAVGRDTVTANGALTNYGQTIINTDGTITNLTDLLKTLNAQWNTTTQDIDQATAAYVMWDQVSSGSSGSGGSKGINASGYFVKPGETTEQALDATFQSLNNTLGGGYNVNPATGYSTSTAPQSPSIPVPSGYAAPGTGVTTSGGTGVADETSEAMSGGTLIPAGSGGGGGGDGTGSDGTAGVTENDLELNLQPAISKAGQWRSGIAHRADVHDGGMTFGEFVRSLGHSSDLPTGTGVTTDAASAINGFNAGTQHAADAQS